MRLGGRYTNTMPKYKASTTVYSLPGEPAQSVTLSRLAIQEIEKEVRRLKERVSVLEMVIELKDQLIKKLAG